MDCRENPNDFKTAPYPVEKLVSNSHDWAGERINKVLLSITSSLVDAVKANPAITKLVIDVARTNEKHSINILRLAQNDESFKQAIEKKCFIQVLRIKHKKILP